MTDFEQQNKKPKANKDKSNPNNLDRDMILTQAFQAHRQGNILEASKHYQLFLKNGFVHPDVLNNYGAICSDRGLTKEAINL